MTRSFLKKVLNELQGELYASLGSDLDKIILFGSQAHGEPQPDSDIDILIVIKSSFDYADLIRRTSEGIARLSLRYDVVISRAFVSRDQFEHRQTPFLINIRREGVPL